MSPLPDTMTQTSRRATRRGYFWRDLWRLPLFPLFIIVVFVVVSLFGEALAPGSSTDQNLRGRFLPPAWLDGHYLWDAVLADLHHRAGDTAKASGHRERALAAAPSPAVRRLLERRLGAPSP